MNKLLIAAAAALFAVASFFATGAEAASFHLTAPKGVSNVHKTGCHGGRRAFRRHAIQSVRRSARRKTYVAEQKVVAKKKVTVAKAEPVEKVEKPVETANAARENSSITTADGTVADAPEKTEQKVAVAKELGCKKFFPSVGMTLTVPCE